MQVVVLGAAGQLGREVVRALVAHKHSVCAVVRRSPDPAFDKSVQVQIADALNKTALCETIRGTDAVVNAIGSGTLRRNNVESTTSAVAVAAAQEAGVQRYIAMSAGMVALNWPIFKYILVPLIFRNILAEHKRVEEIVSASSLKWTIVRPPRLVNGAPSGYRDSLTFERRFFMATRADVADFIADELENNKYVRQAVFVASLRTH